MSQGGSKLVQIGAAFGVMIFLPIIIVIALLFASMSGIDEPSGCPPQGGGGDGGALAWPVPDGSRDITSDYGERPDPQGGGGTDFHNGVDFGAAAGTSVTAADAGKVTGAAFDDGGGNIITIQHESHGGIKTRYMHLSEMLVSVGDQVQRGQEIAKSGNTGSSTTGAHLHFEVMGPNGDTADPMPFLETNGGSDEEGANPPADDTGGGGNADDGSPSIMGQSSLTVAQIAAWYRDGGRPDPADQIDGPGPSLEELVGAYVTDGNKENVRGDLAFIQAVHETGNFGNSDSDIYNFAGIQHYDNSSSGRSFATVEEGVRAQIQLLKKFATSNDGPFETEEIPNNNAAHPGCCPTWASLTGVWATDPNYWTALGSSYQDMLDHAGVQGPVPGGGACGGETGPGGGPDGPVDSDWPAESASVSDPSGTGGQLTPRTAAMYNKADQAGLVPSGSFCFAHRSWGEHPEGKACDFMFSAGKMPNQDQLSRGWALANWAVKNQNTLGVYYVIWQGQIWSATHADEGWRPYESDAYNCPGDNITGCHYDHVHVSMY